MTSALMKYALNQKIVSEGTLSETHWLQYPIFVSRFVPKGEIYVTGTHLMVESLDTIVLPLILAAARDEAKRIVQWGLSDVRAWLGEIDPGDVACDCFMPRPWSWNSPIAHYVKDHEHDCYGLNDYNGPCGGCYGCLAAQHAYYAMGEMMKRSNGHAKEANNHLHLHRSW